MNMKLNSLRFALIAAACALAAGKVQAQTVNASATLSGVLVSGTYDYTLTVHNTGSTALEGLWYGWIPGAFDLPSTPTTAASTSGWSASVSGASIQFQGDGTDSIAAGGTGIFTFDSTSSPTAMTTGVNGGAPTGESVAYAGTIGFTGNSTGVSQEFTPTLASVPEPSTTALIVTGTLGLFAAGRRKLRALI
jgi:PEP-CTERM motif